MIGDPSNQPTLDFRATQEPPMPILHSRHRVSIFLKMSQCMHEKSLILLHCERSELVLGQVISKKSEIQETSP